jgi:hypothetical protein
MSDEPLDLPERPVGFARRLQCHFNFGRAGGAATYSVRSATGKEMPFGYQYDTRKNGMTGFNVPGITDRVFTWDEIRERFAAPKTDDPA